MPIPNLITDLTTTAATNSPAGGESVTTTDDYLRAQASFIALLRDRVQSVALGGTGATTAIAAADALGAFRRGTLLGFVTQSAGVPTGSVIERSSNVNGEYVRFADGTQICTVSLVVGVANAATGSIFRLAGNVVWTFPATFVSAPSTSGTEIGGQGFTWCGLGATATTTTSTSLTVFSAVSAGVSSTVGLTAVGRWF